ncbi:MAG: heparinase II/III family protein [Candidatus Latescibacteria bacterium]|jgi:hypothetical protein|nr:heparinase II/III family protein [Candidatus Latescibacterota bacterium]
MNLPETFFHPSFEARTQQRGPIVSSLLAHLDEICRAHLEPGHADYIDYREREAEWWTRRQGGRVLPAAVEHLAVGGILLDPRYTVAAKEIVQTLVEHRIVENAGGTNYGRPYRTWRDNPLDAGVCSAELALDLDLLRPSLTRDEAQQFGTYVLPFVDYLLDDPPDPKGEKPEHNIACIGMFGLGTLALVLSRLGILDDASRDRALELAKWRGRLFLEKGHDGEGAFYEGPAYGSATLHHLAPLAYALARCDDRELAEHPGWGLFTEGLAHEMIPATGRLNTINDCNDRLNVSWLTFVAAEQRNGLAQWVWQQVDRASSEGSTPQSDQEPWSGAVTRYLLYYDPDLAPTPPEEAGLPGAKRFHNRGLVDIRSGYARDDAFLSFICDISTAGGHRQADRNHFSFHALGEAFAIDSGYGLERLPDTTEVLRLGALGEAHNLPLVHGEMQRRGKVTSDGIRRAELEAPLPYIESEAGESYPSAERFTRRVVCLPDDDGSPSCLLIADRMAFDPGVSERLMLSWLLHTHGDNDTELERDRFTLIGARQGNRCEVQIVTPWPGRWRQEAFLDHPRLRYDWFWNPLLCLVVVAPYRKDDSPPEIKTEGSAAGCGLSIAVGARTYTALSAAPDQTLAFEGAETDAELAVAVHREGRTEGHLLSAGTRLSAGGVDLVNSPDVAEFVSDIQ